MILDRLVLSTLRFIYHQRLTERVNFEPKCHSGTILILALQLNGPIELHRDHIADDQAESYSVGINFIFSIFNRSKELEQFWLISVFDTYA